MAANTKNKDSKWMLVNAKWVKEMLVEIKADGEVQVWKRFASLT